MMPLSARPDWQLLSVLIAMLVLSKAWLTNAAGLELHYDEAQYWEWSQHLDWSYYSKGPLIAWLIALSTSLLGHGEWQVRLPGWLFHGAFVALIFYFTRSVWNNRTAAWWAVAITATTPLYFTLGLVMTTDNLLLVFWTWGLWSLYRALIHEQSTAWYSAGAAIGFGALTKLSIGLLPAFAGIAVLSKSAWRKHLLNPRVWGGLLVLIALMAPLLIWNATHGWVMFLHEVGHVGSSENESARPLEFITSQILALSPLVVAIAILSLWRIPKTSGLRFLWWLSIAWLVFFTVKSFGGKVQANWAAPCYIGMIVIFAGHVTTLAPIKRHALIAGMIMSLGFSTIFLFPALIGFTEKDFVPIKKLKGWRAPIAQIEQQAGKVDFIFTDDYSLAAELAFYWSKHPSVYVMGSASRRFNQHDLWPSVAREEGGTAIVVQTDSPDLAAHVREAFESCAPLPNVNARDVNNASFRTYYTYRCERYRHIDWPTPTYY